MAQAEPYALDHLLDERRSDCNLTFLADNVAHVFNGLTNAEHYKPAHSRAIYISPHLSASIAKTYRNAYPSRLPMEKMEGWTYLTEVFLHEEMQDPQLRASHRETALDLYFQQARGDFRICVDDSEPASGYLRRRGLPILEARASLGDDIVTINGQSVTDFMRKKGWSRSNAIAPAAQRTEASEVSASVMALDLFRRPAETIMAAARTAPVRMAQILTFPDWRARP